MGRNASVLMIGQIFEYRVDSLNEPGQNIEAIAEQLKQFGLVMDKENHCTGNVRRVSDPKGTQRYKALLAEWSGDDEYHDARGEPWHVYVGKVISEGYGTVDIGTLEKALSEVNKDFPKPKVLHCTRPIYIDYGY